MRELVICWVLLIPHTDAQPWIHNRPVVLESALGQYRIERSDQYGDLFALYKQEDGNLRSLWSVRVQGGSSDSKFLMVESQETVIVERSDFEPNNADVFNLVRNGKAVAQVTFDDLLELAQPSTPDADRETLSLNEFDDMWESGGRISFLWTKETGEAPLYALWVGAMDKWFVWDTESGKHETLSKETEDELNAATLQWARDLIRAASPNGPLATDRIQLMGGDGLRVANNTPENWSALRYFEELRTREYDSAMKFVAQRKVPADRALLELALSVPLSLSLYAGRSTTYAFDSKHRALADRLLALWDGKPAAISEPFGIFGTPEYFNLGTVQGRIILPFATESGQFELTIIDAENRKTTLRRGSIETFRPRGAVGEAEQVEPASNELQFLIKGLLPGEYRLTAIWSKDAQWDETQFRISPPLHWHYRSGETPALTLAAGTISQEQLVICTNRVHPDPALYEGDAERIEKTTLAKKPRSVQDEATQVAIEGAIFRHLIARWTSLRLDPPDTCFIARARWGLYDPDPKLFELLAQSSPRARPFTQCKVGKERITDAITGEPAMYLVFGEPNWIASDMVELHVVVHASSKYGDSWSYLVVLEGGAWKVEGYRDTPFAGHHVLTR